MEYSLKYLEYLKWLSTQYERFDIISWYVYYYIKIIRFQYELVISDLLKSGRANKVSIVSLTVE